ncbi:MAG: hypothetical protein K6F61_11560 [Clostridiales bacterium]|nr:hypothetical protein [Clostridia bacterium]MCR5567482.1 hypothetical protein [Clostridiales bacterium]
MNRIEDLRRVTDNTLHGLIADDSLKFRILQKVSSEQEPRRRFTFRTVTALCGALAALAVMVLALNTLQPVRPGGPGEINVFAAGGTGSENASLFRDGFDPGSVVSVELEGSSAVTDAEKCASLAAVLSGTAENADSGESSGQERLVLKLSDGTEFIFTAADPYLFDGDGQCWYCPEFFSSIKE